jgi:hypothetical protein
MVQIKIYPARNGDAFLIKAEGGHRGAVLIDGGYAPTFEQYILPDLVELAAAGYALDLVVATHVDADHVSGLLPLFKANGSAQSPKIIPIRRVLHNSLRSLNQQTAKPAAIDPGDDALLGEIHRRGYPAPGPHDGQEISARQGSTLAALLKLGAYMWNEGDGRPSVCSEASPAFSINSENSVTIIGPPPARLMKLRSWWTSEIRRFGFVGALDANDRLDDAFELLCAREQPDRVIMPSPIAFTEASELRDCYAMDDSITNGSSISLILESAGTRTLMLGDSWAEDIVTALQRTRSGSAPLIFDVIKVSHHGSLRNTSPALLELVDAPVFVISSNGEGHNHPDFPVLKAIVDRPAAFSREMIFNYSTPASQRLRVYSSASGTGFTVRENFTGWLPVGRVPSP